MGGKVLVSETRSEEEIGKVLASGRRAEEE